MGVGTGRRSSVEEAMYVASDCGAEGEAAEAAGPTTRFDMSGHT
ncbi:MAG: hypothetical protein ABFD54_09855 [Armatimonadota bacterium]